MRLGARFPQPALLWRTGGALGQIRTHDRFAEVNEVPVYCQMGAAKALYRSRAHESLEFRGQTDLTLREQRVTLRFKGEVAFVKMPLRSSRNL